MTYEADGGWETAVHKYIHCRVNFNPRVQCLVIEIFTQFLFYLPKIGIVFNDFYQSFAIVLSRHRPNSGLMGRFGFPWAPFRLNQKVRGSSPN